jgi:phosphate transport system substrate-binding protein
MSAVGAAATCRTLRSAVSRRRTAARLAGALVLSCLLTVISATSAGASSGVSLALITGSGSSWAANAVNQWIANVEAQGVQVVFTADGSAAGRTDYALHTVDFAVSDIGYQGRNAITGSDDESTRPYAYLPVTSGGTAFPYNIVVGGKRVTNLRLSGQTISEIFTNKITNWDSPVITAENHGHKLPDLTITTVVQSEGSGTTAMFTQYMNYEFPSLWKAFNGGQSGMTEYWPRQGSNQVAEGGSSQVMNYIASSAANGSIGVDQYSYPLASGFPVVQMENAAGYYVLPSEYNVAVALTKAHINLDKSSPDYLLQSLDAVYGYDDPRVYPLSSYSYTIMPTSKTDPRMSVSGSAFPAKWQTLADFLYYSICQGQEYIGPIGYSALPINLVEAGFQQIEKIKKAAPKVDLNEQDVTTCHNPTFIAGHPTQNHLAQIAPEPPLCDKNGQGPCSGILNGNANNGRGSSTKSGTSSSGKTKGSGSDPGKGKSGGGDPKGGASPSSSPSTAGSRGSTVNPFTGQSSDPTTTTQAGSVSGVPTVLSPGQGSDLNDVLGPLAVLLLLAALVAPPVLIRRWSARQRRQS